MRLLLALPLLALAACGGDAAPDADAPADSGPATMTGDVPDDAPAVSANVLSLNEPYARAAPAGGTSAVYLDIENGTSEAVTLVAASTGAAGRVEIHRTEAGADGLSTMTPVEGGLPVPAGETVSLEPGGLHVMLLDLQRDLVEGDTVTVEMEFEGRGPLTVQAPVRGLGG